MILVQILELELVQVFSTSHQVHMVRSESNGRKNQTCYRDLAMLSQVTLKDPIINAATGNKSVSFIEYMKSVKKKNYKNTGNLVFVSVTMFIKLISDNSSLTT